MEPITLTAYAARRGVSKMAVSRAVKSGRLSKSVVRDATGKPQIADVELADREWAATTDLSKAPAYVKERAEGKPTRDPSRGGRPPAAPEGEPPVLYEGMSLADASAAEKYWKSKLAELKYQQETGELVPARDVEARLVGVFSECKNKLLGVPARVRQRDPGLTPEQIDLIGAEVRTALEDLAKAAEQAA